jgi:hypothetical protein
MQFAPVMVLSANLQFGWAVSSSVLSPNRCADDLVLHVEGWANDAHRVPWCCIQKLCINLGEGQYTPLTFLLLIRRTMGTRVECGLTEGRWLRGRAHHPSNATPMLDRPRRVSIPPPIEVDEPLVMRTEYSPSIT